ncbi:carbohydrate ABC transporter permease [Mesorhizobium sp. LHD-90]|uniref:carbohydrate ABC transporter permease n=1 Tax=Mesorhizobium sp. LHD-90 TaxID=3071414 RepID=UPI0027E1CB8D|nr:carbohydrate ABC transporter permease [Mesorhizobium sp. LHD-90]MDQ6438189.1 carbohydrate ABC transporter permease [Mesorhizobium sp. LHD-90]
MKSRSRFDVVAHYGAALLLVGFVAFPLAWMAIASVTAAGQLFTSPPRLFPSEFTLDWYRSVWSASEAPRFFMNSLVIALATTVACVIIGILSAYATTRFEFPGKQLFLVGALASYVFPAILLFLPVYLILTGLGLTNTLVGIVVAHIVVSFPFAVWMLRSYLLAIPRELDEAAWVDGASYLRTLISVVLPVCLPGVFSTAIFIFVLSWNEFLFASVIAESSRNKTITVGIAEFITAFDVRWGEIMALGTIATVPVVILFISVQRYFLKGVLEGAVKG